MLKIRRYINKLSSTQKITCLILLLSFILVLSVGLPSFARFKNRNTLAGVSVWDGTVASSYRKGNGTIENPYVISDGKELAYFSMQLKENDYDNTYFALGSDIVLNAGVFDYDPEAGITYILDNNTYYIQDYTNKYFDNVNKEGNEIGTINVFDSLDGFKGNFDGKSFRIYGLYVSDNINEEVALFTDLKGSVHDLYVENAIVHGGITTAGIASVTNNSTITNILFDGDVIGRGTNLNKNVKVSLSAPLIHLDLIALTDYIDLTNDISFAGSEIISTSITGNYVINGSDDANTSIKIGNVPVTGGSFEVNLGNTILDEISVETITTEEEATLTFSNLQYNIVYNQAVTGGIIGISNDTIIRNTINKSSVYGNSVSGGIVGMTTSTLNISNSYNVGNIYSNNISGGIVGVIDKSKDGISITKSYNNALISGINIGGLAGVISNNTGTVLFDKVFNLLSDYNIGVVTSSLVSVTKAYYASGTSTIKDGTINGNFTLISEDNLKTKSFVNQNLSFNEFVSFTDLDSNNQNVWIYEKEALPILFIDDLNNPLANINVSVYSWNNFSHELNTIRLDSNITFNIEQADELRPVSSIYYYVSNSKEALTKSELDVIDDWKLYSNLVQIKEEGLYVIYAKVIDDDDDVTYLNTDLLVLNVSGSDVLMSLGESNWSDLRVNLDNVYLDRPSEVVVDASNDLFGIASIQYYVSEEILNETKLDEIEEERWQNYSKSISINENGKYILYIKVTDNTNYITYINSDYIVLDGYTATDLIIGRNPTSYIQDVAYITSKSSISSNFIYTSSNATQMENFTHNLITNILLPKGTKITLFDNVLEKVYEYEIKISDDIYNYNNSCDEIDLDCVKHATYPFSLFKEVGRGAETRSYAENNYYVEGSVSEDFSIVLDFSNTSLSTNYNNVNLHLELHDSNGKNVRPTLFNTIKTFNIYSLINQESAEATFGLTTDYNGDKIELSSDSFTNINITSELIYKKFNGYNVIDTTYEDMTIGLAIRLVDSNGNVVDRKHLKNLMFKIGADNYYPDEDNVVHINLNNGLNSSTKVLTIVTNKGNSNLKEGLYYFKISPYASIDGYYYDELGTASIEVPVNVSYEVPNIEYGFDVVMADASRIIDKINDEAKISFNILQNGGLSNPNIRISLYKKDDLTAYEQKYSLVDLANYVTNNLDLVDDKIYYVTTNPLEYKAPDYLYNNFELNLITNKFENNGYKFIFELYDDSRRIGTIEKYFIVK